MKAKVIEVKTKSEHVKFNEFNFSTPLYIGVFFLFSASVILF